MYNSFVATSCAGSFAAFDFWGSFIDSSSSGTSSSVVCEKLRGLSSSLSGLRIDSLLYSWIFRTDCAE